MNILQSLFPYYQKTYIAEFDFNSKLSALIKTIPAFESNEDIRIVIDQVLTRLFPTLETGKEPFKDWVQDVLLSMEDNTPAGLELLKTRIEGANQLDFENAFTVYLHAYHLATHLGQVQKADFLVELLKKLANAHPSKFESLTQTNSAINIATIPDAFIKSLEEKKLSESSVKDSFLSRHKVTIAVSSLALLALKLGYDYTFSNSNIQKEDRSVSPEKRHLVTPKGYYRQFYKNPLQRYEARINDREQCFSPAFYLKIQHQFLTDYYGAEAVGKCLYSNKYQNIQNLLPTYQEISEEKMKELIATEMQSLWPWDARNFYNRLANANRKYGLEAQDKGFGDPKAIALAACKTRHNSRLVVRELNFPIFDLASQLYDFARSWSWTGLTCEEIFEKYKGNTTKIIEKSGETNNYVNWIEWIGEFFKPNESGQLYQPKKVVMEQNENLSESHTNQEQHVID